MVKNNINDILRLYQYYYGEEEVQRLKNDPGIISNRLKISAAIVNEFLMSMGYLPGAHSPEYLVYEHIKQIKQNK